MCDSEREKERKRKEKKDKRRDDSFFCTTHEGVRGGAVCWGRGTLRVEIAGKNIGKDSEQKRNSRMQFSLSLQRVADSKNESFSFAYCVEYGNFESFCFLREN